MLIAAAPYGAAVRVCPLDADGAPAGPVTRVIDLAGYLRDVPGARLVWPTTAEAYPPVLRAGARVGRCHDLELIEALLLGWEGRWGQPRTLSAAWARCRGAPVPPDPPPRATRAPGDGQQTLFDLVAPPPDIDDPLAAVIAVHRHQRTRVEATGWPRFRLLVAAESAGALVAAEMGQIGLPWRADIHDAVLTELLGETSPMGGPPRRLVELAGRVADALGVRAIHPESPAEVLKAFGRAGIRLPSTRAYVLRGVEHPAVAPLLEYKELYRIWTAHGWSWRAQWVRDGRFHPEYVPGGVVSGRWATRGGGALQIPRAVRRAVTADPGWKLVVADAGQLEPRILAAVSSDPAMARSAGAGDMYAALATESFGGDRARAKLALLGAMYGQTGGQALPALAVLRRSYPMALSFVEDAARAGEAGELVRSWLGRTCPPPSVTWHAFAARASPAGPEGPDPAGEAPDEARGLPRDSSRRRARGRFARNFVIQATAAEWALVLLASLRSRLVGTGAELVFFQHDEVIVHAPGDLAGEVAALVNEAGEDARRLLFGSTPVRFPLGVRVVDSYAHAK